MAVSSPSSVVARVRAATSDLHQQLETAVGIASAKFDRQRYVQLLSDFLGFYAPMEDLLDFCRSATEAPCVKGSERRKARWLVEDLKALGLSADEIDALPRCDALPPARDEAEQLGCMYVMEGSTLGGQVVLRHVRGTLGIDASGGAKFFNSYGAEVGVMWKSFLSEFERCCTSDEAKESASRAASETFRCLHAWITRRDASA